MSRWGLYRQRDGFSAGRRSPLEHRSAAEGRGGAEQCDHRYNRREQRFDALEFQAVKSEREIAELRARMLVLDRERQELQKRLAELTSLPSSDRALRSSEQIAGGTGQVVNASPVAAKVALFRRLFAGRTDVYPVRWENTAAQKSGYAPACANEWLRGVCAKPQVRCTECSHQAFIPVSDEMIESHLRGEMRAGGRVVAFVAGVYPLLTDETCRFLAVDFDGESWCRDALVFVEACRKRNVPAALERSRSGQGGHVWIFFGEPVAARDARQLGALLLTAALEQRPEVGFDSYDRMFPSQDMLPKGRPGQPDRIASAAPGARFWE